MSQSFDRENLLQEHFFPHLPFINVVCRRKRSPMNHHTLQTTLIKRREEKLLCNLVSASMSGNREIGAQIAFV